MQRMDCVEISKQVLAAGPCELHVPALGSRFGTCNRRDQAVGSIYLLLG